MQRWRDSGGHAVELSPMASGCDVDTALMAGNVGLLNMLRNVPSLR